ncbi:hypothetical protein XELAEV_18022308mg [Xenopus laevis]|nr:hypothetical protein XELAEV_18022308mg [Xenopus laevis]
MFSVLLWTGLGISMIVMGVSYMNECLMQPKISIYLIVAGTSQIAAIILLPLKLVCQQLSEVLDGLLLFFRFCWLITGSIWIFPMYFLMYSVVCNSILYNFSFSIVIFQYIYIALFSVILVLGICFPGIKSLSKVFVI